MLRMREELNGGDVKQPPRPASVPYPHTQIPPARPADRSVFRYRPDAPERESRRLARRIVRFSATADTPPNPESRRLARRIVRFSATAERRRTLNPAGSPGGSFGFPLQPDAPTAESRRLARRIVRFSATPERPRPESRRLARRIVRFSATARTPPEP